MFSFSLNNFNIPSGGSRNVGYTINPLITNTTQTNQTYSKILTIEQQDRPDQLKVLGYDEKTIERLEPKLKIVKKPIAIYLKKEHLLRHDSIKLAEAILGI